MSIEQLAAALAVIDEDRVSEADAAFDAACELIEFLRDEAAAADYCFEKEGE